MLLKKSLSMSELIETTIMVTSGTCRKQRKLWIRCKIYLSALKHCMLFSFLNRGEINLCGYPILEAAKYSGLEIKLKSKLHYMRGV